MATTFHLFPSLPKELRLIIWNFALLEPHTITLRNRNKVTLDSIDDNLSLTKREALQRQMLHFRPQDPPPPLTQACYESRFEALNTYTLAFKALKYSGIILRAEVDLPRYTYINFEIDTIILTDSDLYELPPLEDRAAIRKLVLVVSSWESFFWSYMRGELGVAGLRGLREFTGVGDEWHTGETCITRDLKNAFEGLWLGKVEGWGCPKINIVAAGDDGDHGVDMIEESRALKDSIRYKFMEPRV